MQESCKPWFDFLLGSATFGKDAPLGVRAPRSDPGESRDVDVAWSQPVAAPPGSALPAPVRAPCPAEPSPTTDRAAGRPSPPADPRTTPPELSRCRGSCQP